MAKTEPKATLSHENLKEIFRVFVLQKEVPTKELFKALAKSSLYMVVEVKKLYVDVKQDLGRYIDLQK